MPLAYSNMRDKLRQKVDRRAINIERQLVSRNPTANANLVSTGDPYSTNSIHKVALSREPSIIAGRIVEVIEYAKSYKVVLDRGAGEIICCALQNTSSETMGARTLTSYVPGTFVVVLLPPHAAWGFIVGAMPGWMVAGKDAMSDYISQGSNVGLHVDAVSNFPFSLNDNGGIVDFSAGGAFDHVADGDWGAVTDTGGMVFLDSFMAFMRIDEETGIFLFYDNQRARLSGHNLQIRSGIHEANYDDDQWELDYWEGHTTGSNFERMGSFDESKVSRENDVDDYQLSKPWYSRYEPTQDDQQAIFRLRTFRGYFGQGDMKTLCIPPVSASGVQQYSKQEKFPGVAEENWATDGMISIRSAKGLIIAKRAVLPNPKQMFVAEDVNGDKVDDTNDNYRFRGTQSTLPLPNHKVGDMTDAMTQPSLVRAAAFRDMYMLDTQHKNLLGLRYHKLDWYVPNESDYSFSSQMASGISDYSTLANNQWLTPPDPIQLTVDSRYNNGNAVKYWPTDSYLAFLEDGSMNQADGFGSEIRMVDGSIVISCPGDIFMLAGRSIHEWAGWDVSVRGNNCVDIVANKCDVRIKAENTVFVLGGNSGKCGGVLVESRSPGIKFACTPSGDDISEQVGGILLRAKNSAVVTFAAQIELILSQSGDATQGIPSAIVLQAHDGLITTESKHFFRFLHQSAQDVFTDSNCSICGVNEYWCSSALINSKLRVANNVFVDGCLLVYDDTTVGGHVAAVSLDTLTDFSTLMTAASEMSTRQSQLSTWASSACSDMRQFESQTDATKVEFYFRSSEQQQTENFVLFETKWQQEARVKGMSVQKWTENPVMGSDCFSGLTKYSYPPPGKGSWVDNQSLYTQDQTLFNVNTNLAEDWGAAYEYPTPTYSEPTKQVFDGNFLIIKNPCS